MNQKTRTTISFMPVHVLHHFWMQNLAIMYVLNEFANSLGLHVGYYC